MNAISSATASSLGAVGQPSQTPMRQAMKDLTVALRKDDLPAARQAYVAAVKAAPESAQWNPEGSFAAVGRALAQGDLAAAKEAAKAGLNDMRGRFNPVEPEPRPLPMPTPGPMPAPALSSTGGVAGARLNVTA